MGQYGVIDGRDQMSDGSPAAVPGGVDALVVANVIVPLDGTEFAEAALEPASALASAFGARLHVVGVGVDERDLRALRPRLSAPAERFHASVDLRVESDVGSAILSMARQHERPLVVMTSHSRGRLGGALLGSVAAAVVRRTPEPVVLVGPDYDPARVVVDGPVLACVDGSAQSERAVQVGAAWAASLGVPLTIVTVAEPVPPSFGRHYPHRAHGPDDPEEFVSSLADRWRGAATDVSGLVLYDPISPAEGLGHHLSPLPAAPGTARLLVVTTHARTGVPRAVLGSEAAAIVRASPLPVVVVPPLPAS